MLRRDAFVAILLAALGIVCGSALAAEDNEMIVAGRHSRLTGRTDAFTVVPAGADVRFIATLGGERLLHLHLGPAWLEELGAKDPVG